MKQMKVKQFLAGGLAAAVCVGAMAGCSGKVPSKEGGEAASGANAGQKYLDAAKKNKNFNATGDKIVNEKQKFDIWIGQMSNLKKANAKEVSKITEQKTNVQINWIEVPTSGWKEKANVVLASGNLPDAFCGGAVDLANYGERFVPLNNLVEAYAPTTMALFKQRPDYPPALSDAKGLIRGLPVGDEYIGNTMDKDMWINQKWLDKVGMEIPKTTEEFEKVLRAFKDQDPNGNGQKDEIPFSFRSLYDWASGCSPVFGAFGVPESERHVLVDEKTNKVTLPSMDDRYYDCLVWLNKLYKDGLISPTCFTESGDAYNTKNAGKDVVGAYMSYSEGALGNTKMATTWYEPGKSRIMGHVAPLKGPKGECTIYQDNLTREPTFLISTKCKNPEVLVRWYDYVNTGLENWCLWRQGPENKAWKWTTVTKEHNEKYKSIYGKDLSQAPIPLKVGDKVPMTFDITVDKAKALGYDDGGAFNGAESFAGWSPALQYQEKVDEVIMESKDPVIKTEAAKENMKTAKVLHGLPAGMYTKENAEERGNLWTDIDTYLKRFVSNAVVNGIDKAKWTEHLNKLKSLQADRYIQLCQEMTDNIKSRTKA